MWKVGTKACSCDDWQVWGEGSYWQCCLVAAHGRPWATLCPPPGLSIFSPPPFVSPEIHLFLLRPFYRSQHTYMVHLWVWQGTGGLEQRFWLYFLSKIISGLFENFSHHGGSLLNSKTFVNWPSVFCMPNSFWAAKTCFTKGGGDIWSIFPPKVHLVFFIPEKKTGASGIWEVGEGVVPYSQKKM